MDGSRSVNERINILNASTKVIFNSKYIEDCFFEKINKRKFIGKYEIIYNSTKKLKKFPIKKKQIAFVGKLNFSKGYDIYCEAIKLILNEFPEYKAISVGDERKKNIFFSHKNFKELGFLKYKDTLRKLEESDITVIPSRWKEPFGRTSLEASRSGCYTIIADSGGLKETSDHAIILKNNNVQNVYNEIKKAILNNKFKKKQQYLSFKNIKHITRISVSKMDKIRNQIFLNIDKNNKKILNIYNIGIKNNHRLYNISIGKKLTLGFIRNHYDVLEVSERDYGGNFEDYIFKTIINYHPKFIFFGHCKKINVELLKNIKINFPNIKIIEWNEDYLGLKGPDSNRNYLTLKKKEEYVDYFFITTDPNKILGKLENSFYLPIPVDNNIEYLKQYLKKNPIDIFFALSHGVNRGTLKHGKKDEREEILNKILQNKKLKSNIFGINGIEPVWANDYYNELSKCNMGLNLSRGESVNLYSSNRIASYFGNGLLTFIHLNTGFNKIFKDKKEAVFYKNDADLIKKIIYYKKNDQKRRSIAKKGCLKYHQLFNSKQITKKILKTILQ